jgi:FkbM family methyltransferase
VFCADRAGTKREGAGMLTTKTKVHIARLINAVIVGARRAFGLSPLVETRRGGIKWTLDLNEGIDLAIYLGRYQEIPRRVVQACIRPDCLAIDIGANIGSHALPMAKFVGDDGRVVAVEPTRFAYEKLLNNIRSNPKLSNRLIPVNAALTEGGPNNTPKNAFYSRWPLRASEADRHPEHLGQFESAEGARFLSLDSLLAELRTSHKLPSRVAFIKIDVDGNELHVLRGARTTLTTDKPVMLVEITPHVQDEVPHRFESMIEVLTSAGYSLEDAKTGRPLPNTCAELRKLIRFGASIDAIARPISG